MANKRTAELKAEIERVGSVRVQVQVKRWWGENEEEAEAESGTE